MEERGMILGTLVSTLSINESNALLHATDNVRDKAIIALVLHTGLFPNEVEALAISDVDWEKRQVTVPGKRKRVLALDDDTYNALAKWSQERIDSQTSAFFTTQKGKPESLSERSIDTLIRRHAKEAGIAGAVNARILRNTFAVRLVSDDVSKSELARILGITDDDTIRRYRHAAQEKVTHPATHLATTVQPKPESDPSPPEASKQGLLRRFSNASLQTNVVPKSSKVLATIHAPLEAHPGEVVFGRDQQIREIISALTRGQSILLSGPVGVGKTHLLKHINERYCARRQVDSELLSPCSLRPQPSLTPLQGSVCPRPHQKSLYIPSPSPTKAMLQSICDATIPDWKLQLKSRAGTQEMVNLLCPDAGAPQSHETVLIIDNLHRLTAANADTFETLLKHFTILAATEKGKLKQATILWKFKLIELNPLDEDSEKELIRYLTQNIPTSDYTMMENKITSLSNGFPLPIVDMVNQLRHENVATPKAIRHLYHEGGIKYRDWTWSFAALWGVLVLCRFIALGTHSFEGYILAGLGTTVFMTIQKVTRKLK